MYRGVVQDGAFWTDFLRDYIKSRGLELPVKSGRIWRIVHDGMRPAAAPKLSSATPAQLVQTLSHPNGWWRDTAQQLLVQRGDKTIVPQLRALAGQAPDWRTRLHALWTLDGLDALDPAQVERALADTSPDVRTSAVRMSERWLADPGQPLASAVLKLMDDESWTVRRQLAASIGELPQATRVDRATAMLVRYGRDPILVDAALSGLSGHEADALDRMLRAPSDREPRGSRGSLSSSSPRRADAVTMLAATISRSGDAAGVQHLIALATAGSGPAWQRAAVLQGLDTGLSTTGGRGAVGRAPSRAVALSAEPKELTQLAAARTDMGRLAMRIGSRVDWPGKPAPAVSVPPLTPDEQRRFSEGAELYKNICIGCHQLDGHGRGNLAPTLVGSRYVTSPDAGNAARILLGGKEGPIGLMPPLASALSDEQIAAVLTYIRRDWGHTAPAVAAEDVREIRGLTKTRKRPWTDVELPQGRGGRAGGGR